MNLSYFISKRINKSQRGSFTSIIHKIAVGSIATGLAIMIISFMILGGFVNNIIEKNFSFAGHLNVSKFVLNSNIDQQPVSKTSDFYKNYSQYEFIDHVQEYALKLGLIKTEEGVLATVLKGVGKDYRPEQFNGVLNEGRFISLPDSGYSTEVLISASIASRMKLGIGDRFVIYFMQKPPRPRRLTVVGIYDTGLEEIDNTMIIGDLEMIRRLNNWSPDNSGGYEVYLKDFDDLEMAWNVIGEDLDFDMYIEMITDSIPAIFDWLSLINRQVYFFSSFILFLACFNMASILFIMIMERTQMIGVLKAMGAQDIQIRKLFIFNGIRIILRGALIGNAIALGFGFIQHKYHLIPLDYKNYFMHYVPIDWNWLVIILINLLVVVIVSLVLILPTFFISRIEPIKSIRFD